MTCEKFSGLLDQYLEGSLDAMEMAEWTRHLEACDDCRLLLEIRKDCSRLDEGFEVPESFSASWRQAVREQEESDTKSANQNARGMIIPMAIRRWMAVAASLVFVFGGTWLVSRSRPDSMNISANDAGSGMPDYYGAQVRGAEPAPAMLMMDGAFDQMESKQAAEESSQIGLNNSQKIIRTISLSLNTRAFDEDLEKLNAALASHGGYVEYSDISADPGSRRYASLTLRIPKENLEDYLGQVKGIGRTVSITESQEDVSERYSDVETRLQTQTTKMDRLQDLLSKASMVEDILAIEREIADTQYQIDSLTGSLRGMDSKVEFSTLHLYMSEEVVTPSAAQPTLAERIRLALSDAWTATLSFLEDFVVLLSVTLPYLLVLALLALIIRRIIRRKKT